MEAGFRSLWPGGAPRLHFDAASVGAARILSQLPVRLVDAASDADVLWIRKEPHRWYEKLAPHQALNHIPRERAMCRKRDLAEHLHRYAARRPTDTFTHADFFQPTYCLNDPDQRRAFVAQLPADGESKDIWIFKPSNLARGVGMKIVRDFDWIREALEDPGEIQFIHQGQPYEYVIQRYIKDVLLLDGKKSEIRIYWVIASMEPLLCLMFPEGTARLTLVPYDPDDISNTLAHITNTFQQKKHPDYAPDAELKWDFARLAGYLAQEKGVPADFLERSLLPRIRQSLAYVVRATIDALRQRPHSGSFFGLYGADFIIDDQLTPWLTEVQRGPGLSHDDPVKQRVMPAMLRGAASIVLEVLAHQRAGRPPGELSSTHGYDWVIRDAQ